MHLYMDVPDENNNNLHWCRRESPVRHFITNFEASIKFQLRRKYFYA